MVTRRLLIVLCAALLVTACSRDVDQAAATRPSVAESTAAATPGTAPEPSPTAAKIDEARSTRPPAAAPKARSVDDSVADSTALGTSAPTSGNIGDVDFFNNFRYPVSFGEEVAVTVTNGEFIDEPGYLWFNVWDVQYGDLDDDGRDEAVVQTGFNTGGSGQFGRLAVWDIVDDRVVERGWVGTGDRADGGLWHFEIRDGLLITENFLTDQGACCPNMLSQQRLALVSDGLVHVEHIEPLRWMTLNSYDEPDRELKFLAGTSAAIVQLSAVDDAHELVFEAGAGQWVTTTLRRGPEVGVAVVDAAGTIVGQSATTRLELQVPTSGLYRMRFTDQSGTALPTIVDVEITASPVPAGPTWTPAVRELVVDDDPIVRLVAVTPTFDLADNGVLNGAIDRWIGDQTDWWVADVIEYPPVEREGSDRAIGGEYELLYDVTLASDELVSFRWNWYEYVCCRPYPNYGYRSLVVDLGERRVLEVGEIVDVERLDEIHEIWISQAAAEEVLPPDFLVWWGVDGPAFTSLALTPNGIEFGTDRLGAVGGTTTVVPWSSLGDLVQPGIADRARAAITPIRLTP